MGKAVVIAEPGQHLGGTAFSCIRMEPVFMVTSQSAATAACQAIDQRVPVQKVSHEQLRERLMTDQQILEWPYVQKESGR